MRARSGLVELLVLAALLGAPAFGASMVGYRGPENNGIFPAKGLLKKWPKEGPKLLWKYKVGDGWCHPSVVDGLVYLSLIHI